MGAQIVVQSINLILVVQERNNIVHQEALSQNCQKFLNLDVLKPFQVLAQTQILERIFRRCKIVENLTQYRKEGCQEPLLLRKDLKIFLRQLLVLLRMFKLALRINDLERLDGNQTSSKKKLIRVLTFTLLTLEQSQIKYQFSIKTIRLKFRPRISCNSIYCLNQEKSQVHQLYIPCYLSLTTSHQTS